MSMGSQDIAEKRATRLARERNETESYNEARYQLACLRYDGTRITRILDAAKAQGNVMTEGSHRARVTCRDGVYTVYP